MGTSASGLGVQAGKVLQVAAIQEFGQLSLVKGTLDGPLCSVICGEGPSVGQEVKNDDELTLLSLVIYFFARNACYTL